MDHVCFDYYLCSCGLSLQQLSIKNTALILSRDYLGKWQPSLLSFFPPRMDACPNEKFQPSTHSGLLKAVNFNTGTPFSTLTLVTLELLSPGCILCTQGTHSSILQAKQLRPLPAKPSLNSWVCMPLFLENGPVTWSPSSPFSVSLEQSLLLSMKTFPRVNRFPTTLVKSKGW